MFKWLVKSCNPPKEAKKKKSDEFPPQDTCPRPSSLSTPTSPLAIFEQTALKASQIPNSEEYVVDSMPKTHFLHDTNITPPDLGLCMEVKATKSYSLQTRSMDASSKANIFNTVKQVENVHQGMKDLQRLRTEHYLSKSHEQATSGSTDEADNLDPLSRECQIENKGFDKPISEEGAHLGEVQISSDNVVHSNCPVPGLSRLNKIVIVNYDGIRKETKGKPLVAVTDINTVKQYQTYKEYVLDEDHQLSEGVTDDLKKLRIPENPSHEVKVYSPPKGILNDMVISHQSKQMMSETDKIQAVEWTEKDQITCDKFKTCSSGRNRHDQMSYVVRGMEHFQDVDESSEAIRKAFQVESDLLPSLDEAENQLQVYNNSVSAKSTSSKVSDVNICDCSIDCVYELPRIDSPMKHSSLRAQASHKPLLESPKNSGEVFLGEEIHKMGKQKVQNYDTIPDLQKTTIACSEAESRGSVVSGSDCKIHFHPSVCNNSHPSCIHPLCFYNQTGRIYTIFGNRYIFTEYLQAPLLISLEQRDSDIISSCKILWQGNIPKLLSETVDGTDVSFDAVRQPMQRDFTIIALWNMYKPSRVCVGKPNSLIFIGESTGSHVQLVKFGNKKSGKIKVFLDGEEETVQFSTDLIHFNGNKTSNKEELEMFFQQSPTLMYATVYKFLCMSSSPKYFYIAKSIWFEKLPSCLITSPLMCPGNLYKSRSSKVREVHTYTLLHYDVPCILIFEVEDCTVQFTLNNESRTVHCPKEIMFFQNNHVSRICTCKSFQLKVKAHILERKEEDVSTWRVKLVQIPVESVIKTDSNLYVKPEPHTVVNHSRDCTGSEKLPEFLLTDPVVAFDESLGEMVNNEDGSLTGRRAVKLLSDDNNGSLSNLNSVRDNLAGKLNLKEIPSSKVSSLSNEVREYVTFSTQFKIDHADMKDRLQSESSFIAPVVCSTSDLESSQMSLSTLVAVQPPTVSTVCEIPSHTMGRNLLSAAESSTTSTIDSSCLVVNNSQQGDAAVSKHLRPSYLNLEFTGNEKVSINTDTKDDNISPDIFAPTATDCDMNSMSSRPLFSVTNEFYVSGAHSSCSPAKEMQTVANNTPQSHSVYFDDSLCIADQSSVTDSPVCASDIQHSHSVSFQPKSFVGISCHNHVIKEINLHQDQVLSKSVDFTSGDYMKSRIASTNADSYSCNSSSSSSCSSLHGDLHATGTELVIIPDVSLETGSHISVGNQQICTSEFQRKDLSLLENDICEQSSVLSVDDIGRGPVTSTDSLLHSLSEDSDITARINLHQDQVLSKRVDFASGDYMKSHIGSTNANSYICNSSSSSSCSSLHGDLNATGTELVIIPGVNLETGSHISVGNQQICNSEFQREDLSLLENNICEQSSVLSAEDIGRVPVTSTDSPLHSFSEFQRKDLSLLENDICEQSSVLSVDDIGRGPVTSTDSLLHSLSEDSDITARINLHQDQVLSKRVDFASGDYMKSHIGSTNANSYICNSSSSSSCSSLHGDLNATGTELVIIPGVNLETGSHISVDNQQICNSEFQREDLSLLENNICEQSSVLSAEDIGRVPVTSTDSPLHSFSEDSDITARRHATLTGSVLHSFSDDSTSSVCFTKPCTSVAQNDTKQAKKDFVAPKTSPSSLTVLYKSVPPAGPWAFGIPALLSSPSVSHFLTNPYFSSQYSFLEAIETQRVQPEKSVLEQDSKKSVNCMISDAVKQPVLYSQRVSGTSKLEPILNCSDDKQVSKVDQLDTKLEKDVGVKKTDVFKTNCKISVVFARSGIVEVEGKQFESSNKAYFHHKDIFIDCCSYTRNNPSLIKTRVDAFLKSFLKPYKQFTWTCLVEKCPVQTVSEVKFDMKICMMWLGEVPAKWYNECIVKKKVKKIMPAVVKQKYPKLGEVLKMLTSADIQQKHVAVSPQITLTSKQSMTNPSEHVSSLSTYTPLQPKLSVGKASHPVQPLDHFNGSVQNGAKQPKKTKKHTLYEATCHIVKLSSKVAILKARENILGTNPVADAVRPVIYINGKSAFVNSSEDFKSVIQPYKTEAWKCLLLKRKSLDLCHLVTNFTVQLMWFGKLPTKKFDMLSSSYNIISVATSCSSEVSLPAFRKAAPSINMLPAVQQLSTPKVAQKLSTSEKPSSAIKYLPNAQSMKTSAKTVVWCKGTITRVDQSTGYIKPLKGNSASELSFSRHKAYLLGISLKDCGFLGSVCVYREMTKIHGSTRRPLTPMRPLSMELPVYTSKFPCRVVKLLNLITNYVQG
ncbi:hypothetical protein SK128_028318 [Halocaridina rubra]|uniref:Uncharacterized protein n=1 Tax=Halocaridina rubra TaxID=373956 RepID=A0AAN8XAW9_HALRR